MSIRRRVVTVMAPLLIVAAFASFVLARLDAPDWTVVLAGTAIITVATYKLAHILIPAIREPEER